MKRRDIVKIYEDPITCKKLEGIAKLYRRHDTALEGCERWDVVFLGEGDRSTYVREVNLTNH